MAIFSVRIGPFTALTTIADANALRILAAEAINLDTGSDQETVNRIAERLLDELKGDTRTIERNAAVVPPLD